MKKYFIFIILVLIGSLVVIQCQKKCDSKKLGDIRFTQSDLNIVPYVGTENLIFKDSIGDSIFEHPEGASGRISIYDNHYYEHYFSQDECPPNYYDVEQNYTQFEGADYSTSIYTDLFFENPFATPIKKCILIQVAYEDSQKWFFSGTFYFDSLTLYGHSSSEANIVTFNDSLKIGSKQFFKVYTLLQNVDPYGLKNLQIVYYSINRGVVGFKTDQGHLWYLALSF